MMKTEISKMKNKKKSTVSINDYKKKVEEYEDNNLLFFKDVLAKCVKDRSFCIKLVQSRIKKEHFPRKYMSWVFGVVKEFMNNPKYGSRLPTFNIFKDKLDKDNSLSKEMKISFYSKIRALYKHIPHNEEYSMESIENKITYREFKESLHDTLKNMDSNPGEINKLMNSFVSKTFKISNQNSVQIVDLYSDFHKRQKERLFIKKNPGTFKRFHFGVKSIDSILPGGLMQPMMASVAAKTGRGKSVFTITFGDEASKQGFNVTHITSENENFQTTGRYDSKITKIKYDDIQLSNLNIKQKKKFNKVFMNRVKSKNRGNIKIVKFPPNDFTAASIQHVINVLEAEGHKTDFLIVDSPDLMQSVIPNLKDKRLQQAAIYWELKCVLESKKCIGFVTTQLTKLSSDDNPSAEDLSESYDKARMLDFLMVLTQSKTQRASNEASIVVVKNRDGKLPSEAINISTNFSIMHFEEKPLEENDDDKPSVTVDDKNKKEDSSGIKKLRNIAKKINKDENKDTNKKKIKKIKK